MKIGYVIVFLLFVAPWGHAGPKEQYAACSKEIYSCMRTSKTISDIDKRADQCWRQARACPKTCVKDYFERRKSGRHGLNNRPLFLGSNFESSSCIPGLDAIKYPGRVLPLANSRLRLVLMLENKLFSGDAAISLVSIKAPGKIRTSRKPIRRTAHYQSEPLTMAIPAGRYFVVVRPLGKYKKMESLSARIQLQPGQVLNKAIPIGPGGIAVVLDKHNRGLQTSLFMARKGKPLHKVNDFKPGGILKTPHGIYTLKLVYASGQEQWADVIVRAGRTVRHRFFTTPGGLEITSDSVRTKLKYRLTPIDSRIKYTRLTRIFSNVGQTVPIKAKLLPGAYLLSVWPSDFYATKREQKIQIKSGVTTIEKFNFSKPGILNIVAKGIKKPRSVLITIRSTKNGSKYATFRRKLSPTTFKIGKGVYDISIEDPGPAGLNGSARDRLIKSVEIKPNKIITQFVDLPPFSWGWLEVGASVGDLPLNSRVRIRRVGVKGNDVYNRFRYGKNSRPIKIVTGKYRIWISAIDKRPIYPQPIYRAKPTVVEIKSGEKLKKVVQFKAKIVSDLEITVMLNGMPTKGKITGRPAGSGSFGFVPAKFNLVFNHVAILPGNYDLKIRPLTLRFTPGIDVFKGRKSSNFTMSPVKGTTPIILRNVHIGINKKVSKTVWFKVKK